MPNSLVGYEGDYAKWLEESKMLDGFINEKISFMPRWLLPYAFQSS